MHPWGACNLRAHIFGRCAGMHWPCADFIKADFVQVLFCSLTGDQRDLYRAYISSEEVQDILNVSICSTACVHRHHGGGCLAQMVHLQVLQTKSRIHPA